MKYLLSACAVLLLGLTGCVSGSNYAPLPDIKQNMAEKHPVANVLTPYSGDGFFINTGKDYASGTLLYSHAWAF